MYAVETQNDQGLQKKKIMTASCRTTSMGIMGSSNINGIALGPPE